MTASKQSQDGTAFHPRRFVVVAAYAATTTNRPQRCISTDYFNDYNFSKAQIIHSLMMVIKPKHVGDVLM